ncbi:MAG: GNAT family N-acetyltransferase [Woeseia sp.]
MRFEIYSPRWQSDVARLANEVFGDGYFVRPSEIAVDPGSIVLISHENDDVLLGFAQGRLLPPEGLVEHLERRVSKVPTDIADADSKGALGAIQAIAVAPEWRGRRIGTTLIEILHDRLIGLGADKLIITFKRGPREFSVDGMMTKLGFDIWERLPSYWQARCEGGEFHCIDRHNGCTCEALLYRKAVY